MRRQPVSSREIQVDKLLLIQAILEDAQNIAPARTYDSMLELCRAKLIEHGLEPRSDRDPHVE